jgi:formylglycine-generating enzyme required for sulfatase activity
VQLLAVSSDPHRDSQRMIEGVKAVYGVTLTFPLLADPDARVIGRYGVMNMDTAPGPESRKFATPATYILDTHGVVRWRMLDDNFKVRPTNEVIVAALKKIQAGADASAVTLDSVEARVDPVGAGRMPARLGSTEGMVLVPAGAFSMGDKSRRTNDSPAHQIQLDGFYIDATEVTNRAYRTFLAAVAASHDHSRCHPLEPKGKDHTPAFWNDSRFNRDDYPVVGVDWFDAYAYAAWAGKMLPTEAQWERAARGGDGRAFSWGEDGSEEFGNINAEGGERGVDRPDPSHTHGPKPVASYKPYGFGVYDLNGNVEEWCLDWYDTNYYLHSPVRNPSGPDRGSLKSVRGGSWHHGYGRNGTRYMHSPDTRAMFLGFRCVRPAAAPDRPAGQAK